MSAVGSNDSKSVATKTPPAEAAVRRTGFRKALRLVVVTAGVVVIVLSLGFLWFAAQLPKREVVLTRTADGIVVLTGGSSRVNDAFELMASKRGRRLLITGVYPATNPGEILRVMPEYERLFTCCVDLDRSAVNTLGNAIATRRWTREQGFRSLIIVTSAYHMPRALVELAHQLPEVTLVPFPVVTEKSRAEPWWSHISTAKLLVSEYLKYIVAVIRIKLDPSSAATTPSRLTGLRQ
jgi:uncharacterized SAM-binding protein YcdF (DUF218 family)